METETDVCPCVCVCDDDDDDDDDEGKSSQSETLWKRISNSCSEHLVSLTKCKVLFLKCNQRSVGSFDWPRI